MDGEGEGQRKCWGLFAACPNLGHTANIPFIVCPCFVVCLLPRHAANIVFVVWHFFCRAFLVRYIAKNKFTVCLKNFAHGKSLNTR